MEKMQALTPMSPMEPTELVAWWPAELGTPSTSGAADDVRYAYFPDKRRLLIERGGTRTLFDTADHQFRGVLQSSAESGSLTFLSQLGRISVDSLTVL